MLLGAGWRLRTGDGRVPPRLAGVLWLGAVAAFAGLLAVLLGGRSDDAVDDPTLAVAGGALVLAGGLYLAERRGLWLGLAVAVALLVAGSAWRRNVLLGIGAAALVVFLSQAAGRYGQDLGAPLVILLVGLGLVAVAVVLARLRPARGDRIPR